MSPATEVGAGAAFLMGMTLVIDPATQQWLDAHAARVLAASGLGALVACILIALSPTLPLWRIAIARIVAGGMGGGMIVAVGGSIHDAGNSLAFAVFAVILGGAGTWVFILTLQEWILERQKDGSLMKALGRAVPSALSRIVNTVSPPDREGKGESPSRPSVAIEPPRTPSPPPEPRPPTGGGS